MKKIFTNGWDQKSSGTNLLFDIFCQMNAILVTHYGKKPSCRTHSRRLCFEITVIELCTMWRIRIRRLFHRKRLMLYRPCCFNEENEKTAKVTFRSFKIKSYVANVVRHSEKSHRIKCYIGVARSIVGVERNVQ